MLPLMVFHHAILDPLNIRKAKKKLTCISLTTQLIIIHSLNLMMMLQIWAPTIAYYSIDNCQVKDEM